MPEKSPLPSPDREPDSAAETGPRAREFGFAGLLVTLGVAAAWTALDLEALSEAAALHRAVDYASAYFLPEHALLLYVRVPLALLASFVTVLAPGLLLTLPRDGVRDVGTWLVKGLAASIGVLLFVAPLADAVAGATWTGASWVGLLAGVTGLVAIVRWSLWRRAGAPSPGVVDPSARALLGLSLAACWLLAAVLAPKLHWESFNGDGAHAYEACRALLWRPVPFHDPLAGAVARYPTASSFVFAYPASWFLRIFGECEASVRAPLFLYLALLVGIVASLARSAGGKAPRAVDVGLLWGCVMAYAVSMGFSATYSPYHADLALPATQDTLFVCCFLAFAQATLAGPRRWVYAFALLVITGLPSGMMLIVFWVVARLLVVRPLPKRWLAMVAVAAAVCLALSTLVQPLCSLAGWPAPGDEYRGSSLLRRFADVQLTDLGRLAYVAVPAGIVPVLAVAAWRRQDAVAKALTLVFLAYFGMFFVVGHVSLHHFVPAMILPWPVAWRVAGTLGRRGLAGARVAVAGGLVVALWSAIPADVSPCQAARRIGSSITVGRGSYADGEPDYYAALQSLAGVFYRPYDAEVPDEAFGLSPLSVARYAAVPASRVASPRPCYLLLPAGEPGPPGARRVEWVDPVVPYVLDEELHAAYRTHNPGTDRLAPLLRVRRGILYRGVPLEPGPGLIRLGPLVRRLLGREAD